MCSGPALSFVIIYFHVDISFPSLQVRHPSLQHNLHLPSRPLISLLQFTSMLDQICFNGLLAVDQVRKALELGFSEVLETEGTVLVDNRIEGRS